jgi:DNA-binding transcriptional LysR family regulator
VLFTEPRWVALPATPPLAGRDRICFRELWDEPFVATPGEAGAWRDWWLAAGEREGHPVRIGAVTETGQPDDWLTAFANGDGVALAPESGARYYARPGITYRPVTGVSPSRVGVAWPPAADTNPVIRDFIRCCLNTKPPPPPATSEVAAADARDDERMRCTPPATTDRRHVRPQRQGIMKGAGWIRVSAGARRAGPGCSAGPR